jgi:hypothetical protein
MSSPSRIKVLAAATVLGTVLAGCSEIYSDRRETVSASAGEALAANKVTQVIDPWPRHSARTQIAFSGERIQIGTERYRHNRSITPVLPTQASRDYQAIQQQAAAQQAATTQSTSATPAAAVKGPDSK